LVVIRIDLGIHERQARRIWDAVIGGFVRLRPPLVRSVGHDLDGGARRMDVDLQDFVRTLEIRPCFHGSLRDSLGKLAKWKTLGEATADAERLTELWWCDRLAAHDLEEPVAPFEDIARARHPVPSELHGKDRLAAGVGCCISLPV